MNFIVEAPVFHNRRWWLIPIKGQAGVSLIETLAALALLGIIGVVFLSALTTTSNTRMIADEHTTARILAESQMEELKKQTYALSYDPIPIPPEYPGYSAMVEIDNLRNGNIQKITITVGHRSKDLTTLECYKTNR